jgi:hypothetical protein
MRNSRTVLVLAAGVATLVVTGCAGLTPAGQTQARIRERPTVFQALSPTRQSDILGGAIECGFTTDMVYLALGKPKKVVVSADGQKSMWIYEEHYAVAGPATLVLNSHDTAYRSQIVSPNTPFLGGPKQAAPMDFHTTDRYFSQSLEPAELKTKTVYVFFLRGKVAEIKLDGDASDQRSTAAEVKAIGKSR